MRRQTRRYHRSGTYSKPPGVGGTGRMQGGSQQPFFVDQLSIALVWVNEPTHSREVEAIAHQKGTRTCFERTGSIGDGPPLVIVGITGL